VRTEEALALALRSCSNLLPTGRREVGRRLFRDGQPVFQRNTFTEDIAGWLIESDRMKAEAFASTATYDSMNRIETMDFVLDFDTLAKPKYLVIAEAHDPTASFLTLKKQPEPTDAVIAPVSAYPPRPIWKALSLLESEGCSCSLFFSGAKGFHVYCTCPAFARALTADPVRRELASYIAEVIGLIPDMQVTANRRALIRLPFSINLRTGVRKVPIRPECRFPYVRVWSGDGIPMKRTAPIIIKCGDSVCARFGTEKAVKKALWALSRLRETGRLPPLRRFQPRTASSQAHRTAQSESSGSTPSSAQAPEQRRESATP